MIDKATTRRGLSEPVRPEGPLNRAHAGLSAAARFMARVGGASLLAMAFVIVFEVFARKFFGFTITGIDETAGFVYACAMAWGFAFALFERAHIRVDLVHSQLPRGIQHILDATGLALMLGLRSSCATGHTFFWRSLYPSRLCPPHHSRRRCGCLRASGSWASCSSQSACWLPFSVH